VLTMYHIRVYRGAGARQTPAHYLSRVAAGELIEITPIEASCRASSLPINADDPWQDLIPPAKWSQQPPNRVPYHSIPETTGAALRAALQRDCAS